MNDEYIVTAYVVIDDVLKGLGYQDDPRSASGAAEILTIGVIAAKYFQNHHERSLCLLKRLKYIKGISLSRFNRRFHQLKDWLYGLMAVLGEIFAQGEVFVIDSMPLPVCKRARARRCKKVRGAVFCGYCAAKRERFFGWRLHLICTAEGLPVSFDFLPASEHDLTPVHELASILPSGAYLFGDKAYISGPDAKSLLEQTELHLVSPRRKNMAPNTWAEDFDLARYRKRIENLYSQMESMGTQRLHARTNEGFELKALTSLLALTFTNLID